MYACAHPHPNGGFIRLLSMRLMIDMDITLLCTILLLCRFLTKGVMRRVTKMMTIRKRKSDDNQGEEKEY